MKRFIAFVFLVLCILPATVQAESRLLKSEIRALELAAKGAYKKASIALRNNRRPYLKDLILWLSIKDKGLNVRFDHIDAYLERQPDWPSVNAFYLYQERSMPVLLSDGDVINFFEGRIPYTLDGLNRLMAAHHHRCPHCSVDDVLQKWWALRSISAEEQRAVYKRYGKYLSHDNHVARLQMLMAPKVRQYTNARWLARQIGKGYPEYIEARIALQNPDKNLKPNQRMNEMAAKNKAFLRDPYFVRDRFYWHKEQEKPENNRRAVSLLQDSRAPHSIPDAKNWWRAQRIVINRLVANKVYRRAYDLAKQNPFKGGMEAADLRFIAGWLALRKLDDPISAEKHFKKMYDGVTTANSTSQAAYWLARAYEEQGKGVAARQWYGVSAQYPYNFYGQLSAEKDGCISPVIPARKTPEEKNEYNVEPKKTSLALAYSYLMQAGLEDEAWLFLNALSNYFKDEDSLSKVADIALAHKSDFHALRIAKKGYNLYHHEIGTLAFPVLDRSVRQDLSFEVLVHALIRQESGFDQYARSRAGALGLTQMLPSTAKIEAEKIGVSFNKKWLTEKPKYSVMLGEAHLQALLGEKKDQHIMRVLASYNAGARRVDEWVKTYGDPALTDIDPIDWLESLPFTETRDYVKKVLENYVIYGRIFAHPDRKLLKVERCQTSIY